MRKGIVVRGSVPSGVGRKEPSPAYHAVMRRTL